MIRKAMKEQGVNVGRGGSNTDVDLTPKFFFGSQFTTVEDTETIANEDDISLAKKTDFDND